MKRDGPCCMIEKGNKYFAFPDLALYVKTCELKSFGEC